MNLAFHYHIPALLIGGKIKMPGFLGFFIDGIAPYFEKVILYSYEANEDEKYMMDYDLNSENVYFVSLGIKKNIPLRTLTAIYKGKKMFNSNIKIDIFLVRASTPLLPFIYQHFGKKVYLLLVSDALEGLDNLEQPGWRLYLIKKWAQWYQKQEDSIATKTLTFVNSNKLYLKLQSKAKNLELLKTTTLREGDFFIREDTCQENVINILFTGRITKTKGVFDIMEALALLKNEGIKLCFHVVGMVSKGDDIIERLKKRADGLGLIEEFKFHGYKAAGEELLTYYRIADIYVIAPQGSSEGFPRTIWEAMASSVPVVATNVSSISNYIGHCAVIVEPKNVLDLLQGIKKVISNHNLRKKNIKESFKLAKFNTIEKRSKEMIEKVIRYYSEYI